MKPRVFFRVVIIVIILTTILSLAVFFFSPPASPHTKCNKYGVLPKIEGLSTYTVKQGDSLLSIAKSQLGNPSRANELARLNNDTYPGLSVSNPFLEVGWILALPPQKNTLLGSLNVVAGEIVVYSSGNGWGIFWPGSGLDKLNSNIPEGYKNGTCVIAVYQQISSPWGGPPENQLISIKKQ